MFRSSKNIRFAAVALLCCCALISACSVSPQQQAAAPVDPQAAVKTALYQQYHQWRGVPYRMGGGSKGGVDCSALVQITYKDVFDMSLPRSTSELADVGDDVKPGRERSGDLVFFKTSFWSRHVGIYLENGNFMHASSSRGVMISNLSEPYWRQHYWKTLRPAGDLVAGR